jgi:quinol-cytochrome oxidoreductase complex cytochrome b subunit
MPEEFPHEPHVKFFPYQIMLEVTALLIIAGILITATSFPAEVRPQYDPMNPPIHLEPEWYFMPVYQVLKTQDLGLPLLGFMSLTGILLGLMVMPFLDKGKSRHPLKRPKATAVGVFLSAWLMTFWNLGTTIAPEELQAWQAGAITLILLLLSIILVQLARLIYFRHGDQEVR